MINPLQYYALRGRPIGIWIGCVLLPLQFLLHLRGIFFMHRLPVHTLIVSAPLFAIAFTALLMRRYLGMWLANTFFTLSAYMPMFVIPHLPFKDWWCVAVWWITSAIGIISLYTNRRWFDDPIIHFECGE